MVTDKKRISRRERGLSRRQLAVLERQESTMRREPNESAQDLGSFRWVNEFPRSLNASYILPPNGDAYSFELSKPLGGMSVEMVVRDEVPI